MPHVKAPATIPSELQPQLQQGKLPHGGFVRIPVSGPGVGTRETGGQYLSPGDAAWNAIKWKLPLGPAYSERPTTGTWGTDPGKQILKRIPFVGSPIAASAYASENPVQWTKPMGEGERAWETFKNVLGYASYAGGPVGQGLTWASRGIDIAEGLGELFGGPSAPPAMQDRTGVYRAMMARPGDWDAPKPLQWGTATEPFQEVQPTFSPFQGSPVAEPGGEGQAPAGYGSWPQPTQGPVVPRGGDLREPWAWTPRTPWT